MKKMHGSIVLGIVVISIVASTQFAYAGENEYGIYDAWVKLNGEDTWREIPVENISLNIHEPFYVKAILTTKTYSSVSCSLCGAGKTVTFEVIDGPSSFDESLRYGWQDADWSKTIIWEIRPTDSKFVGGYTPLRLYAQFTKQIDLEGSELVDYDYQGDYLNLVYPFINNNVWDGYSEDTGDSSPTESSSNGSSSTTNDSPGFELILILLALGIMIFYKRRRN